MCVVTLPLQGSPASWGHVWLPRCPHSHSPAPQLEPAACRSLDSIICVGKVKGTGTKRSQCLARARTQSRGRTSERRVLAELSKDTALGGVARMWALSFFSLTPGSAACFLSS